MNPRACLRLGAAAACLAWALIGGVAPPAAAAAEGAASEPRAAEPVDLNAATASQLEQVPGIGKTMAERIVTFRDRHGPFRRVEDLLKVKGIGEKSFQKLRPHFKVDPPGDR